MFMGFISIMDFSFGIVLPNPPMRLIKYWLTPGLDTDYQQYSNALEESFLFFDNDEEDYYYYHDGHDKNNTKGRGIILSCQARSNNVCHSTQVPSRHRYHQLRQPPGRLKFRVGALGGFGGWSRWVR